MEKNWIYAGAFLTSSEKLKLLHEVGKLVPDGWMIHAGHCTIVFNDGNPVNKPWYEWAVDHEGENRELTVTHIGKSNKSLAVKVEGMLTRNKTPHITIAVSPDGKPVDSNYIENWEPLEAPIKLTSKIKVITRK